MEREILKKGNGLLRQGTGVRYRFIDSMKKAYSLTLLCKVLEVSRSGFYCWKKREKSLRQQERDRLIPKVKEIHKQVCGSYGARRISEELEAQGEQWAEAKPRL